MSCGYKTNFSETLVGISVVKAVFYLPKPGQSKSKIKVCVIKTNALINPESPGRCQTQKITHVMTVKQMFFWRERIICYIGIQQTNNRHV